MPGSWGGPVLAASWALWFGRRRLPLGVALLPVLVPWLLWDDRGPGMTWNERLGMEMDRIMLAQQRLATACDAQSAAPGAPSEPPLVDLHQEIARRYRDPIEDVRRYTLRYYRREFRAFWIRGIALGRAALVRDLVGSDRADPLRCAVHRERLHRRLREGWPLLRAEALSRLP